MITWIQNIDTLEKEHNQHVHMTVEVPYKSSNQLTKVTLDCVL